MDGAPMMVFARGSIFSRQRCPLPVEWLRGLRRLSSLCPASFCQVAPSGSRAPTRCSTSPRRGVAALSSPANITPVQSNLFHSCQLVVSQWRLTSHIQNKTMRRTSVSRCSYCLGILTNSSPACKWFRNEVPERNPAPESAGGLLGDRDEQSRETEAGRHIVDAITPS